MHGQRALTIHTDQLECYLDSFTSYTHPRESALDSSTRWRHLAIRIPLHSAMQFIIKGILQGGIECRSDRDCFGLIQRLQTNTVSTIQPILLGTIARSPRPEWSVSSEYLGVNQNLFFSNTSLLILNNLKPRLILNNLKPRKSHQKTTHHLPPVIPTQQCAPGNSHDAAPVRTRFSRSRIPASSTIFDSIHSAIRPRTVKPMLITLSLWRWNTSTRLAKMSNCGS
jgi:hypothetical protein